jgi:hypothetical protein
MMRISQRRFQGKDKDYFNRPPRNAVPPPKKSKVGETAPDPHKIHSVLISDTEFTFDKDQGIVTPSWNETIPGYKA